MKKEIIKIIACCDICGRESDYANSCDTCDKDICFECRKGNAAEYSHSVHFSGSGDGFYCAACDAEHRKTGTDKRHRAYLRIQELREESKAFYEDWERRAKEAQSEVEKLA